LKPGRHIQQAVVLNRINYGEADLIVGFFTSEYGMMKGIAKHGRKSRKRFGNVLTPSSLVEVTFSVKSGRDLAVLESGELIRSFEGINKDIRLLARVGQTMELVDGFCALHDPAPDIYELLLWCLDRFNQGDRYAETSLLFMIKLLKYAGFGPNLLNCSGCGRNPDQGQPGVFKMDMGGLSCPSCAGGGFAVNPGTVKLIALVQNMELGKLGRIRVGDGAMSEFEPYLLAYIRHLLGRDLKTCQFMDKLDRIENK
jgi:DNA repair protein RecO (recombination protein O)